MARARVTCRNCPCKQDLVQAWKQAENSRDAFEAQIFQLACLNMLHSYGFHVDNKNDALACIKELCERVNAIEIHQSMGVGNES